MADVQAGAAVPQKLDELMLAMDVVDTLRHQEGVVEKVLAEDDRDEALKERLRKLYEGQGLAVSDRILDDGIKALKESRFTYDPAPPSFKRWLALMWVSRGRVGKVLAVVVVAAGVAGGVSYWRAASTERAAEAARVEIEVALPEALDKAAAAALSAAVTTDAKAAVDKLVAAGKTAVAAGNAEKVKGAIAALGDLRDELGRSYELRIVSRPGEKSGVYRIPNVNTKARNYYLIVEAVDPNGNALSLPVTSEEDGKTTTVDKWALRVPKATYEAVASDKRDDGIIENDVIGEKPQGALEPSYSMDVLGGAITAW